MHNDDNKDIHWWMLLHLLSWGGLIRRLEKGDRVLARGRYPEGNRARSWLVSLWAPVRMTRGWSREKKWPWLPKGGLWRVNLMPMLSIPWSEPKWQLMLLWGRRKTVVCCVQPCYSQVKQFIVWPDKYNIKFVENADKNVGRFRVCDCSIFETRQFATGGYLQTIVKSGEKSLRTKLREYFRWNVLFCYGTFVMISYLWQWQWNSIISIISKLYCERTGSFTVETPLEIARAVSLQ